MEDQEISQQLSANKCNELSLQNNRAKYLMNEVCTKGDEKHILICIRISFRCYRLNTIGRFSGTRNE